MEQQDLPFDHCYLRCVESHAIPGDDDFRLVICMTTEMSLYLVEAKRISIDTSFKRVRGWYEFEIECWDNNNMRCKSLLLIVIQYADTLIAVVAARAFITSQSAHAHLILFRRIFEIARTDLGMPVTFFHIGGVGIETVIADGHRGQALGISFSYSY